MNLKLIANFSLSIVIILLIVCAYTDTSISIHEAEQIVFKEVLNSNISGIKIYKLPYELNSGDIIKDGCDSTEYVAERDCWFFYIDDIPEAKFAHPVRYIFIYCDNGEYRVINEGWWPHLRDSLVEVEFKKL